MSLAVNQLIGFGARRAAAAAAGGNDANTIALLHCDGADASTTVTNSAAGGSTTFTANGDCQIDTAFSKFGSASLLFDGSGDTLTFDGSGTDWTWAGDFAVDLWIRCTSKVADTAARRILGFGSGSTSFEIFVQTVSGVILVDTGAGTTKITGTTDVATSTWKHVAVTRSGTSMKLFVDGVQEGSTATDSTTWAGNATSYFGRYQGSAIGHYAGSMDEIRVSKGDARWTANFTPPTVAYS
jgi:hypothetical protein